MSPNCIIQLVGKLQKLKHILNIAYREPRCQMHELVQPVRLLIARAKIARAVHLFEKEFRDLAIFRLSGKVGVVASEPLRLKCL